MNTIAIMLFLLAKSALCHVGVITSCIIEAEQDYHNAGFSDNSTAGGWTLLRCSWTILTSKLSAFGKNHTGSRLDG